MGKLCLKWALKVSEGRMMVRERREGMGGVKRLRREETVGEGCKGGSSGGKDGKIIFSAESWIQLCSAG
jgi:hypothetical protein